MGNDVHTPPQHIAYRTKNPLRPRIENLSSRKAHGMRDVNPSSASAVIIILSNSGTMTSISSHLSN